MADHDHAYKLLFSHPEMVRDLLGGFVREDWLAQLDYGSLERLNSSYVTDDLRERADDVVWRVRWGKRWVYVYLLIEFQSSIDRFMAVRILTYIGLLYQDLIRTKQLTPDRQLPPVLPIVLYNGDRRWSAPDHLHPLIQRGPPTLKRYLPEARYLVIDEGAYDDSRLAPLRNLAAALFRLEHSRSAEDVYAIVRSLRDWLEDPAQTTLRRAFAVWINTGILAKRLGEPATEVEDLQKMATLLETRMKEWDKAALQKGRQEGEAELLLRQLRKRFGDLPVWVESRLKAAPPEQLEQWGERLLEADSLETLFGGG